METQVHVGKTSTYQAVYTSANKLDDYEEGTWTPTFGGSPNPTLTYTLQDGFYTKVGRIVHASARLGWTGKSGGSGQLSLLGLPFAGNNSARGTASISYNDNGLIGSNGNILIHSNTSSNKIYFMIPDSTFQSSAYLQAGSSGLASGTGNFQIAITYITT